ncbi:MAG: SDR family oxidoreductase [Myxococcales bacterium]|nr:SDR family oxidoreductase [Myxococcales bacterium]
MGRLAGRQILVVGASSGIGHATAKAFAREGAAVAVCARRVDRLEELAAELGDGAIAVPCDVRDPEAIASAVEQTVAQLGGLTDLVVTAGIATLSRVADATAEQWREAFEINVMGPSLFTSAALPHLSKSGGRALFVSSIVVEDNPPRHGLGLYSATKAALNRMIDCWQAEERSVSFTRVSVGDTMATEMASAWAPEDVMAFATEWSEKGYLYGRTMEPDDVALHLVDLLAGREAVPVSVLVPRYGEG